MPATGRRGSALITVLFVVLAITLLGAAVVVVSGRHLSESRQRETSVGLSNCALGVRQYLAAQIAAGGGSLTSLSMTIPGTSQAITLVGGHYDAPSAGSFSIPSGPPFGGPSGSSIQSLSNALPMSLGSSATQRTGTAICTDANSPPRTFEVEFSFVM